MLKQRVITAVILLPLVIASILLLPETVFALLSLAILIGVGGWEWARMAGHDKYPSRWLFILSLVTLAGIVYHYSAVFSPFLMAIAIMWWIIALLLMINYQQKNVFYQRNEWIFTVAAHIVLVAAWWFLNKLHGINPHWILYLLLLIVIADTAAYFSGRRFGKRKLAPELSPGKTIEGVLGAIAGVLLWSMVAIIFFNISSSYWLYFVLLSVLTALLSVAGDLFVSMMKREAGLKDSGSILPGHGGLLDRVDSLLAAIPLFTIGLLWAGLQNLSG